MTSPNPTSPVTAFLLGYSNSDIQRFPIPGLEHSSPCSPPQDPSLTSLLTFCTDCSHRTLFTSFLPFLKL